MKMAFEKVSPKHSDKVADRIAGAIVDLAYSREKDPKIAVEVLLGHWNCYVIIETGTDIRKDDVKRIVRRIAGPVNSSIVIVPQDKHLSDNQKEGMRCGDNGIFKGVPVSDEEKSLTKLAKDIFSRFPYDGKYITDGERTIICHSNTLEEQLRPLCPDAEINPLGYWTGGSTVDSGATNRKLGSDMGRSVTGGGLHGKDLSKADVSVNIYAFLKAQETGEEVNLSCAIGDEYVDGRPYSEIVEIARKYIEAVGGFEKFAEWGLIR